MIDFLKQHIIAGCAAICIVTLAVTGHFLPLTTPDTASYLIADLAGTRTPLYRWLFGHLPTAAIPFLQVTLFMVAVAVLLRELQEFGVSRVAIIAVAIAMLASNALFLDANALMPELPAVSCAVLANAGILRATRTALSLSTAAWIFCAAGLAYLLRPVFLPLVASLPVLCLLLCRFVPEMRTNWIKISAITALCFAPFIAFSILRLAVVGDANIVSRGGFQSSAMTSLMLDDGIVARLPNSQRALAARMLRIRQDAERTQQIIGIPLNSSGSRSYASVAVGYPDVLARTYDDILKLNRMLWDAGERWVHFDAKLSELTVAVVRVAPQRRFMWLLGTMARFTGHALVLNVIFVLASVAWAFRAVFFRRRPGPPLRAPKDIAVLVSVAATWTFSAGLLAIAMSFPAERYIATAALFIPALPLYGLLSRS